MKSDVNIRLLLIPFLSVMDVVPRNDLDALCSLGSIERVVPISAPWEVRWHGRAENSPNERRTVRFADYLP